MCRCAQAPTITGNAMQQCILLPADADLRHLQAESMLIPSSATECTFRMCSDPMCWNSLTSHHASPLFNMFCELQHKHLWRQPEVMTVLSVDELQDRPSPSSPPNPPAAASPPGSFPTPVSTPMQAHLLLNTDSWKGNSGSKDLSLQVLPLRLLVV